MKMLKVASFILLAGLSLVSLAQKKSKNTESVTTIDSVKNLNLSGLKFRSIGPAITGGRIVDIAVNPTNFSEFYVASGHGSLWKTTNHGTTFSPAFEGQSSFAIGAVEIDPSNSNVVWVGTGENNNQTNVIYGDGVYKSEDGGASWKNMGLKNSEHIGGIAIHPKNSQMVLVAAYGPMRNEGGDRGIYKTTDGGATWRNVLNISSYTGCFEVHIDPTNTDIVYASAHQRMRKNSTSIRGGNESAVYRSTDGGETWTKMMKGMPSENVGRIGLAISPVNSDIVYAVVEAKEGSGLYKSTNRGASWSKQSTYNTAYPFYMQKIYADPKDENKLYAMDLFNKVSLDGGITFKNVGEQYKHVDNHCMWIDPERTDHLLSGCDGGIYETWDGGNTWEFNANIPITEIYKVSTDNALPFYNVYIGTQDNNSLMGPSRTLNTTGISNRDWVFTHGGDGFETQADWKDDNIIYAQSQNGGLVRYDKRTGEEIFIQPVEEIDSGYRFDWDSPLLISKHNHKRIYFAANKLFKSDDQGNTWQIISPDLTKGVPQQFEQVMNRSWSIEELAFKGSAANISAIAESPLDENLLFVGSADGLIFSTTDGGKSWNKGSIAGINENARIHHIVASHHNKMVAYAACQAVNSGDYKPYLFKTIDGGKTWKSISSNLPIKGSTYTIAEDHVNENLLFVGTQFGLYMTVDGGQEWLKMKGGLPTTSIMDIEIQKRADDLVVSTFGRGVYILDDYSPLRKVNEALLAEKATIFPIKSAKMYIEANPFGYSGKGFQGASFYTTSNPEVGATFTYYIKDDIKTLKDQRIESEKAKQKKGEAIPYPTYDQLKTESEQQASFLLFVISDETGNVIKKMKTDVKKGVHRIYWDMRYPAFVPITFSSGHSEYAWASEDKGFMVLPGKYTVELQLFDGKSFTELVGKQTFVCEPLNNHILSDVDRQQLKSFNQNVAELTRVLSGTVSYKRELDNRLKYIEKAVLDNSMLDPNLITQVNLVKSKLDSLNQLIHGDGLRARYEASSPVSVKSRIDQISGSLWSTTSAPTKTYLTSYKIAESSIEGILASLRIITTDIEALESVLESNRVPYTPGRIPVWKRN